MGRSGDLARTSGEIDGDDTGCHILHVDMDAFFVSVELRSRPDLVGLPVVVGGTQGRGVVAAASYRAREFGVRSAMPMGQALRLCPQLIVLAPSRADYTEASRAVLAILSDFTPVIEPMSLDEAFIDVAGALALFGRPVDIARQIRRRVSSELRLTCSVGIAPVKSAAKLASGTCKPNGLRVVSRAGLLEFLHPMPVTALAGVGQRTAEQLHRLGIQTVADLADTPVDTLRRAVGAGTADQLRALANGKDARPVTARSVEKSTSSDRTLVHDLLTEREVATELLRGSADVGQRLRKSAMIARTVGIKIRFADFTTITRVRTLAEPTDLDASVYAEALSLYRCLDLDKPRIRLVGVKVENLQPAGQATQLSLELGLELGQGPPPEPIRTLAGNGTAARESAQRAVDAVTSRFSAGAVIAGSLIGHRDGRPYPSQVVAPTRSVPREQTIPADQRSGQRAAPRDAEET